ncbi:hypothetical protein CC78DRAFT_15240 [Lojkania enalia]|uniref:Uncharacterized protein n=1 Tax=Lojkania enalia TaxID=147567 RepID=A0A9P4KFF5_9PLEO|nr:hypothetical protein CC78DRAFT_15240 [Didymosphaeria enalia]
MPRPLGNLQGSFKCAYARISPPSIHGIWGWKTHLTYIIARSSCGPKCQHQYSRNLTIFDMASSQLAEPIVTRSGSSVHSREEDEFTQQSEENPLEVQFNSSVQPTPSHMVSQNPMELVQINDHHLDEPPPPYEEPGHVDAPQIAPIEYSCENSPQLLFTPLTEFPEPPPRNPARLSREIRESTPVHASQNTATPSEDQNLYPAPLQLRPNSRQDSIPRRPVASSAIENTFSSAKAREAGFEIQRRESSGSLPSISILSSTEALKHTREPGRLTAYLIPFPKPRLKGVNPENIPDRFLVYTPPPPPLSKPAPGEKESHWHKTQRTWQEDVRKATMSQASAVSWKGFKARTTVLIGKGVDLTKSSNLEFLDRVADGAISESVEATIQQNGDPDTPVTPQSSSTEPTSIREIATPVSPIQTVSSASLDSPRKPKALEELTLIYPPSLSIPAEKIRAEFIESLLRTRSKSRKEAIVASSLFPVAATIDATLLITFGGLMEVSGVWAYTSIRGAMTSKRMTKGLARGEENSAQKASEDDTEIRGCTCGHHEQDFGPLHTAPPSKCRGKKKKPGINLHMQISPRLEILRRYLDLMCLRRDFNMFPSIAEAADDPNEAAILEAIGWQPTRRHGRDLEIEFKDKVEKLSPEEDEQWQVKEAMNDVKRLFKKGAGEWVGWCKGFQKDFQKDREAAVKK